MNTSTDDDDQPGLWPLAETGTRDTAANTARPEPSAAPRRRRRAMAVRERGTARHQNTNTARTEMVNLWSIDDVSRYLAISKDTIYGWRKTNYGPPPIKVGKHLRWRPEAVAAWAKEQELSEE